jgi:hypothetical protein
VRKIFSARAAEIFASEILQTARFAFEMSTELPTIGGKSVIGEIFPARVLK